MDERTPTEIEQEEAEAKEKENAEDSASLEAELKKDPQLKTALALLEGWDIMKKTLKSNPTNDNSLIPNQVSMN